MMETMYPKQYEEMEFHSCIGDSYYFYVAGGQRMFVGDYSDFNMWRKAKLEKECREAMERYDEEFHQ